MNKIFIYGKKILFLFLLLVLLLLLLLLAVIPYSKTNSNGKINGEIINGKINSKEKFLTINNDQNNDGKMNFDYLVNPNYKNNILSRYYIDDDKKINGSRIIQHPYQNSIWASNIWGNSKNTRNKYYGDLFWTPLYSNYLYKTYGIRL